MPRARTGRLIHRSSDSTRIELLRLQPQRGPTRRQTSPRQSVPRHTRSWSRPSRRITPQDSLLILRYQKCRAIWPNTSPQFYRLPSRNLTGRIRRLPAVTHARWPPRPLRPNSSPSATNHRLSRWDRPSSSTNKLITPARRHFSIPNRSSPELRLLLRRLLAHKSNLRLRTNKLPLTCTKVITPDYYQWANKLPCLNKPRPRSIHCLHRLQRTAPPSKTRGEQETN